jgi:predicted flap endonuclease-1-like 5' DNA nuclease
MTALVDIEGIGDAYAAKLKSAGVTSVEGLLEAGATPKGRKDLAEKSGISGVLVLRGVNHADLYRIKGIGSEYSELLEASGVDTVVELAKRKPENLSAKMVEVNAEKKLVRKLPTEAQVAGWVEQAKALPRVVNY